MCRLHGTMGLDFVQAIVVVIRNIVITQGEGMKTHAWARLAKDSRITRDGLVYVVARRCASIAPHECRRIY